MSDPKPSKPILRRRILSTKVPTLLSVPDLSAKSMETTGPVTAAQSSDQGFVPDAVDVYDDNQIAHSEAEELAQALPEPSIEPLVMDDLAAAAGLTDDELASPDTHESLPETADVSTSDTEDNWFSGNLRRDMGTIATIAATVVACTLVARFMRPSPTSDSFPQTSAVASVEEEQQQQPLQVDSQQNPQLADTRASSPGFAQTPIQQPVGNQQPRQQQFSQQQFANQAQSQLNNATNSAQRFVQQGVETANQQIQDVANQVSAGATALLPQNELPSLPQLNAPAVQQNLRNAANQVNHATQFRTPQQVANHQVRNTPNSLNAPSNLNAPGNAQLNAPQASWPSQTQQAQPQNQAVGGQQQGPTSANPADYPSHLFPNNSQRQDIVDPARSANRYQEPQAPKAAQNRLPDTQRASAYPQTQDPSLQQLKSEWEQQQQQRIVQQAPAARVADQRGFNNYPTPANTNQNRFEANTYQNGNQNFPGGVNR